MGVLATLLDQRPDSHWVLILGVIGSDQIRRWDWASIRCSDH